MKASVSCTAIFYNTYEKDCPKDSPFNNNGRDILQSNLCFAAKLAIIFYLYFLLGVQCESDRKKL